MIDVPRAHLIISTERDEAGRSVQAPYLPARGVVLMDLDDPA